MSSILKILGVTDTEAGFVATLGQQLVFDAINQDLAYHNADVEAAAGIFVKGNTENFKMRWMAPGSGQMTPSGQDPQAPGPAVSRHGEWDVAFPLRSYDETLAGTSVGFAYMTGQELEAHLDGIQRRHKEAHIVRILTAIFENTALPWTDIKHGALTIQRLANADAVTYPPLPGVAAEAIDDHYDEANYTIAQIAAGANNPAIALRDEIIEHYGGRNAGGENILILHNADATGYLTPIAGYVPVPDRFVNYGDDTDLSQMLERAPGRLHGRLSGTWLSEWAWIPATFMIGVHLDYPPLLRRVDTAVSGLPAGLRLVATNTAYPLESSYYRDRFGYAVVDRLAAAVLEIVTNDDGYEPPSAYAEGP